MKHISKPGILGAVCAAVGMLCLFLRQWLLSAAPDEKGLLPTGHPVSIIIWILTAAVSALLLVLFFTWNKQVTCLFQPTPVNASATILMAVGYGFAAWKLLQEPGQLLYLAGGIAGIICVLCTLFIAVGQFRNMRMHPLLYCPGPLFLLCYMVTSYPQWSSEPQMQYVLFQIMSTAFLVFSVYGRAELAAGKSSGRNYAIFSRAAIFFSIAAAAHSEYPLMYGCFAAALALDGCDAALKPPKTPDAPGTDPVDSPVSQGD